MASLTKKELIALEHEWRLKLKESGFQDIEAWDNNVNKVKKKQVRFIKGHIRYKGKTLSQYWQKAKETEEYFRVIGLFAHNCKDILPKYVELLKDYSISGSIPQSIKNTNSQSQYRTVADYIRNNFSRMLKFVKEEFKNE